MSEPLSKARKTAEIAVQQTQSQFIARTRAVREHESEIADRDEKTRRLREARLARDLPSTTP